MASPQPPPLPPYAPPPLPPVRQSNGMATAGFVLAICAWVLGWVIPLILSVLAIVFSAIGMSRAGRVRKGRGLAVTGLVLGIMSLVIPILAAIAIPAFMDYMKRGKTTEATLNLNKIARSAKRVFNEVGSFPVGTSARLPGGGGCCGKPGNKCDADPNAFHADPVWNTLEFEIFEPSRYQYEYSGTADRATVTAIGDLDCDGTFATWTMTITKDAAGNPTTNLVPPPAGVE